MTSDELLKQIDRISKSITQENVASLGPYSQACEFLRIYAGPKSSFYTEALSLKSHGGRSDIMNRQVMIILKAFAEYIQAGLAGAISPERRVQLDVVSDLLAQADALLSDTKVHPAAAAVLIGATLEEFLRTWVEKECLALGNKKPTIDSYATILRESDLLDKQDIKDITAWAGIRNEAAHGQWDKVENRDKISLMLQGVNLFLRKNESK